MVLLQILAGVTVANYDALLTKIWNSVWCLLQNYKLFAHQLSRKNIIFKAGIKQQRLLLSEVHVSMGPSFCSTEKDDLDMTKYGYLQIMAIGSKGSSGVFLVSSFCEQINSAANLMVTDRTSLLSHKKMNIFVTLLMNKFVDTWSSSSNMTSRDNQLTLPNLKDDTDIIQTLEWMINSIIQNTIIQLM